MEKDMDVCRQALQVTTPTPLKPQPPYSHNSIHPYKILINENFSKSTVLSLTTFFRIIKYYILITYI